MKLSNVALLVAAGALAGCSSSSSAPRSESGAESEPEPGGGPEKTEPRSGPQEPEPAKVDQLRSALQRNTDPQLSELEREILAPGQVDFAVDLYHAVRAQGADRDIFLSPHSISIALAMTYAGARGQTAAEMKKALRFDLPDDRLHTGFAYLDLELANRTRAKDASLNEFRRTPVRETFRLNVVNSIWGQRGSSFEMPFLDTLAIHYGAGLNVVDFVGEPERSRVAINRWVEDKTANRIKDLMPRDLVNDSTRMVLVNAVYFNAPWAAPFDRGATKPAPFTKVDGSTVDVMMMSKKSSRPYATGDGYEAVEMSYAGNKLSMLVIAPSKGSFATFESSLTGRKVLDILASLEPKELQLFFPKLKTEAAFKLKPPLETLGMQQAFDPNMADFSGMSTTERLNVQDVVHKTFLAIDEKGTEAAAATGVGATNSSAPPPPPEMRVDRPFIMAIIDRPTKTLLFLGRILEPKL